MSGTPRRTTLSAGGCNGDTPTVIRGYREAARKLPAPDERWQRTDQPAELDAHIHKFLATGIIRVVGEDGGVNVYRTSPDAYEYAQDLYGDGAPGPCDHGGVRTIDADAGVYSCTYDGCDARFGRDVAERRLNGGGSQ